MSIPVSVTGGKPSAPPGLDNNNKVKDHPSHSNKVKDVESPASATAKARASSNSAIVQTSLNVALKAGNDPLALLLNTAINGINEALEPALGKDAIQKAASQDNTPEGTAGRIVSLSTAFYDAYRQQQGLEDNQATREQFIGVIQGGFEKGFKEAQDVLEGLKVLDKVSADIDKTFELVLKGYQDFIAGPQVDTQPGEPAEPAEPAV